MLLAQADTSGQKKTHEKTPIDKCRQKGCDSKGIRSGRLLQAKQGGQRESQVCEQIWRDLLLRVGRDKAEFDKTPAKYAPQYGGFCANGMSKRKLSAHRS